jgi:hypothetical protein
MNSCKYLPVNDNENNTEAGPGRCHLVPRILSCTVCRDGALCTAKKNTFAAQLLPYQRLAGEWKDELHGEMHRSYGVS